MNIVVAKCIAKLYYLLYGLKLMSYESYDREIDKLTVAALKNSLEERDGSKANKEEE